MPNKIDPTVVIDGDVELGVDNEILPYSILIGPLSLGDGNLIGPHVVIGSPGQDTRNARYDSSDCAISIGSRNIIREFTAIQKPSYRHITSIGDDCFLMHGVHIPHDAVIQDEVVVAPFVAMGGIAQVMKGANLGISSSIHQYAVIGPYSMVAMGAAVVKNVRPFSRYIPGRRLSVNEYAIEKFGFTNYAAEIRAYVHDRERPMSPQISILVAAFEEAHATSGRDLY